MREDDRDGSFGGPGKGGRLDSRVRLLAAVSGGLGGALLLVVWASPGYLDPVTPHVQGPWAPAPGQDIPTWLVTTLATLTALWALRWWPHLLAAAGALTVLLCTQLVPQEHTRLLASLAASTFAIALVAVLGCAQGLARSRPGWAAVVAGTAIGARLAGTALTGATWLSLPDHLRAWHLALAGLGLVLALAAMWWLRHGDPAAAARPGEAGGTGDAAVTGGTADAGALSWRRIRPVAGVALMLVAVLGASALDRQRLAALLGVSMQSLDRHPAAELAVVGAVTLVAAAIATAVAGPWALAGGLTAAVVQVAVGVPVLLALATIGPDTPALLLAVLAGAALGLAAAASRWRVAAAGALATAAAVVVFIAYGATGGHPEKLALQHHAMPALLLMAAMTAAATAVVGATAPPLAARGVLPAVLGPAATVLTVAGAWTVNITYHDGDQPSGYLVSAPHLTTSAVLLLVAAAAVAGFGVAELAGRLRRGGPTPPPPPA